jgi:hypothetical protein
MGNPACKLGDPEMRRWANLTHARNPFNRAAPVTAAKALLSRNGVTRAQRGKTPPPVMSLA